jgi:hypothetical protein
LFQSLDPWKGFSFQPQTLHGYTYVLNNPTTFSDPRGLLCILGFGNCHEEYDLFTLPYRFLPNDFCLPGGFGCWGGEEYADWLEKEYFPNLPIQDAVNNIIPQLPKSRVTDSYPFPCNDGPNNWDAWKAKHDLTSWLVTQMKENASGRTAQIIRNLLANGPDGFAAANVVWYMMVKGDAPWDFKKDLRQYGYFEVVLGKDWYGYDVPANIHYGYVGFAIGFDRQWLHFWAGAAQIQSGTSDWRWSSWFFDDPKDYEALRVGMDLFELYGSGITAERLTLLLEERKLLLNLAVAPKPPGYN